MKKNILILLAITLLNACGDKKEKAKYFAVNKTFEQRITSEDCDNGKKIGGLWFERCTFAKNFKTDGSFDTIYTDIMIFGTYSIIDNKIYLKYDHNNEIEVYTIKSDLELLDANDNIWTLESKDRPAPMIEAPLEELFSEDKTYERLLTVDGICDNGTQIGGSPFVSCIQTLDFNADGSAVVAFTDIRWLGTYSIKNNKIYLKYDHNNEIEVYTIKNDQELLDHNDNIWTLEVINSCPKNEACKP